MGGKLFFFSKVEKILKGSLDSNPSPSPSVKIQITDGKVYLRCKGKTFENKKFVDKDFVNFYGLLRKHKL